MGADALVNPSTGNYLDNADDRVFKDFDLSGYDVATLNFSTRFTVLQGDTFSVNYLAGGGDPFVLGGVQLVGGYGDTGGQFVRPRYDISACIGTPCSVGFQLLTDKSGVVASGVAIRDFSITKLKVNTTSYNTIDGTSMASPEVAGVAALVWAYNPNYTYTDVINAIKLGGRTASALAGKTTTGKVANAMGALSHINAPTGVTVKLQ